MVQVRKKQLAFIIPFLFLFIQCNNESATDISVQPDSTSIQPEDTSRLSGIKPADVSMAETVKNALVFHVEDTMEIGTGYKVTLALGKDIVLEELKAEVQQSANARSEDLKTDTTLKVAAEMRARLKDLSPTGQKSFDITPLGEGGDIQEINEETDNKAFWQWNVVPLKEGKHELELIVEVVLDKKRKIFLPSRTMPVMIYSKPESSGAKFSAFMEKNWQWFFTGILIPILVAWITTRIRQRQQSATPKESKKEEKK
jgi:hypothetical protein